MIEVVDRFRDAAPDVIRELELVHHVTCLRARDHLARFGDPDWGWLPEIDTLVDDDGGVLIETRPARRLLDYLAGLK